MKKALYFVKNYKSKSGPLLCHVQKPLPSRVQESYRRSCAGSHSSSPQPLDGQELCDKSSSQRPHD